MKLKKSIIEFFAMEMALQESKVVPDFGFQIFVSRNLKRLESELESIKEKGKPSEAFAKIAAEYDELRSKLADQDDDGNPVIEVANGAQSFKVTDMDKFNKETEKFWAKEVNAKIKAKHDKETEKFRKHVEDTEIEIDLITFNSKHIPEEFFNKEANARILSQVTGFLEELFT